jgi:hypothetical protein
VTLTKVLQIRPHTRRITSAKPGSGMPKVRSAFPGTSLTESKTLF